jgi:hypothetical protein
MGGDSSVLTEDEAKELAPLVKGAASVMEERIRKEVTDDLDRKNAAKVEEAVDEALVRYMGAKKSGGSQVQQGEFPVDHTFAAYAHTGLLGESWMPVPVNLAEGEQPSNEKIREAVDGWLTGFPLTESFHGGKQVINGSDERLLRAMRSADQKVRIDPHGSSIVTQLKNYIIGQGVKVSCHHDKANRIIGDFWFHNKMDQRLDGAVARRLTAGEHYFFYFIDPETGDILVRDSCKPWDILEIECHTEDVETRLAYGRDNGGDFTNRDMKFYADLDYFEQAERSWGEKSDQHAKLDPLQRVQMVKYGTLSDIRGVTPLYPVLRYLKYYEDFLVDRIILNHERSKVVWIKVVKGHGAPEAERAELAPPGGTIMTETPFLSWKTVSADIKAHDAAEDGRLIRLAICAGVGIPEHILFQDASNAVYGSISKHDTPFAQSVRSHQKMWEWDTQSMLRFIIRENIQRNKLPENSKVEIMAMQAWHRMYSEVGAMITEGVRASTVRNAIRDLLDEAKTHTRVIPTAQVQIDVRFPDPVQEDPLQQAQRAEVLQRIQVASQQEIAGWFGLNWEEQDELQKRAGGWRTPASGQDTHGKTGDQATDSKPGETTTEKPDEE